jgi:hypothetical protein
VQIGKSRDIALKANDVLSNILYRLIKFGLPNPAK